MPPNPQQVSTDLTCTWHHWDFNSQEMNRSMTAWASRLSCSVFLLAVWTFGTAEPSAQSPQAPLSRSRANISRKTHQELHRHTRKDAIPASKHVKANKKKGRTQRWCDLPVVTVYRTTALLRPSPSCSPLLKLGWWQLLLELLLHSYSRVGVFSSRSSWGNKQLFHHIKQQKKVITTG